MLSRRCAPFLAAVAASAAVATALPIDDAPARALSSDPVIEAGGATGMVGFGAFYGSCGSTVGYTDHAWWGRDGRMERPLYAADRHEAGCAMTMLRWELYPGSTQNQETDEYDPYTFPAGGSHVQRTPADGPNWKDPGTIPLPFLGDTHGAFRATGKIVSATPITEGRLKMDTFQVPYDPYPGPGLVVTNTGAQVGAFATTVSRGDEWTAGVAWPGQYRLDLTDTQNGVHLWALTDLRDGAIPTIDLDAWCFGFEICQYVAGGPLAANGGGFHPLSPTRILDTRAGVGIANGPIRPGDGRLNEPNPYMRIDSRLNHEIKVTGNYGVPATGVAAVLLNVTSTMATDPGFVSLVPRPPNAGDVLDDQSSYGALPNTSNLNVAPGLDIPNAVVATVGAGGKIRIYSNPGSTHLIADIAGWIDNSGTVRSGSGFTGLTPERLVDTRLGLGGATFAAGNDRVLKVAGVAGVPADATSVVLNVTGANAAGTGWAVAYPNGETPPNASTINLAAGRTRANLAVVKVGRGGSVRLRVAETSADLIVDVFGYYSPGAGAVVPITPTRVVDTRATGPLGDHEVRRFPVAGVGGVPAGATAAIVNVTALPTANGYLTVWPSGTTQPTASNVNFAGGQDVPNLAMVALGEGGKLDVFNELGATHVLIDVMAYVR